MGEQVTARTCLFELVERTAKYLQVDGYRVFERDQHKSTALARHITAWLLRQEGWSYPEIGRMLNRDHSTIMSSVKRVELERVKSPAFASQLEALRASGPSVGPTSSSASNAESAQP